MTALARPGLSACIVALNEEDRIADCVRSVAWCDEVLVVDAHSLDQTGAIAAGLGARVVAHGWPGYSAQKEFAVRNAGHDWVLCVDADERVSPALRREILALRDAGFRRARGWVMPRLSHYLGGWIRHGTWYPDRCLRLFDRRHGRWGGCEPHAHVDLEGRPDRLTHPLLHFPYRSFGEHLDRIDSYTTIVAQQRHGQGTRAALRHLVVRPWAGFLRSYVLKRGFLDGWRGLLLAYLHAYYVRMKWAKLFVLQHDGDVSPSAPPFASLLPSPELAQPCRSDTRGGRCSGVGLALRWWNSCGLWTGIGADGGGVERGPDPC